MVRWRCSLLLAMLLLVPVRTGPKLNEEEVDDSSGDDSDDENDDDNDEDEDDRSSSEKLEQSTVGGRRAAMMAPTPMATQGVTRTVARLPLECYVCTYKAESQLKSCLEPAKYTVHTMVCHSAGDQCFLSVISKENSYESVLRGCRSGCVATSETTCCELNRCNNQVLVVPMPTPAPRKLLSNEAKKAMPSVLYFVTVLLILQTVVKVAIV